MASVFSGAGTMGEGSRLRAPRVGALGADRVLSFVK